MRRCAGSWLLDVRTDAHPKVHPYALALPIKIYAATHRDAELSMHFHSTFASVIKRIRPCQTISTQGISGNAHVVNVAGDHITHVNEGLGADTYALLESIEERLKVVQDKDLGTSSAAYMIP